MLKHLKSTYQIPKTTIKFVYIYKKAGATLMKVDINVNISKLVLSILYVIRVFYSMLLANKYSP